MTHTTTQIHKDCRMPSGRIEKLDPEILETLRERAQVSKEQIAVHTGVTPNVISRWFNGQSSPSPSKALALANYLDVDVLDLSGKTMATADIMDLRQRMGWTAQDAANASAGTISKQVIYYVERGVTVPLERNLNTLASLYEVTASQIRRSWVNRRIYRFGRESLRKLTDEERELLTPWGDPS